MKNNSRAKSILFLCTCIITVLIPLIIRNAIIIIDIFFALIILAVVYLIDKKYNFSITAISLVIIGLYAHILGVISFYSTISFGYIGYDKLVHFISSIAGTYIILEIMPKKKTFINYFFAVFVLMGLGSIIEINEFIGTVYFNVQNNGVFAISDNFPIISNIQKYDTYYDMITNLISAIIGSVIFYFVKRKSHHLKYPYVKKQIILAKK